MYTEPENNVMFKINMLIWKNIMNILGNGKNGVFIRCTDLTGTVVDFWCWEEHKRLQHFFIVYSSRKHLVHPHM